MNFHLRIIDEGHFSTMTDKSFDLYTKYGNNIRTIWVSATPRKILNNIKDCYLSYFGLKEEIEYKQNNHKDYINYPDLKVFNLNLDEKFKNNLKNALEKFNVGFDIPSLFNLKNGKFIQEEMLYEFLKSIFGSNKEYDFNEKYMLNNIKDFQLENNSRISTIEEPKVFLFFLPCYLQGESSINNITNKLIEFMKLKNLNYEYSLVGVNSENNKDLPQNIIKNNLELTKRNGKKGLIVFCGKQLSLGITIKECDVIFMCNGIKDIDLIYQMTFRCMTEIENKKYGILVDCHLQRKITISLIFNEVFKNKSNKNILNNINEVITNIIKINKKDWINYFHLNDEKEIPKIIYQMYIENGIENIEILFENFDINLSEKDQLNINKLVGNFISNKKTKKIIYESPNIDIPIVENNKNINLNKKEIIEKENNVNIFKNIFKHLIPVIHLLCINEIEYNFYYLLKCIFNNKFKLELFSGIIKTFWNDKINIEKIKVIINITMDYFKENEEFIIINERIHSLFNEFKNNKFKMSDLIEKYLTPTEFERKNNAEISTPKILAIEMIEKFFWEILIFLKLLKKFLILVVEKVFFVF